MSAANTQEPTADGSQQEPPALVRLRELLDEVASATKGNATAKDEVVQHFIEVANAERRVGYTDGAKEMSQRIHAEVSAALVRAVVA